MSTVIDRSLLNNIWLVPTFVDLQGFIVNKKFIVKEVAVLKQGTVLTHYIFTSPVEIFNKIRQILRFLVECHHALRWEDGKVPYNETKGLITPTIFEHDAIVYVKDTRNEHGCETCFWMMSENGYKSRS
ncbi:hypothetical protein ALC53_06242 [Atta colombica]|uniref:Uncharacterized protein n=1 Tax=Atta colombica TaxID=520822 RepID=A0A151I393_9HYME|nr:hypothetical protein ALC53_06242 [Atta colombica]